VALAAVGSLIAARRRPLTWLLLLLAAATFWLALGAYLISGPAWLGHPWLPWRTLSRLPVLKEILPDQFVPLMTLFLAFLLAVGLDALHGMHRRPSSWLARNRSVLSGVATLAVAAVALTPVLTSLEAPLRVVRVHTPPYLREATTRPPAGDVVLTIPFAVSGSTQPMLWQAMQGMRFQLAGAALKTPNPQGGPVGAGAPGSARRILTDLSVGGPVLPTGTPAELATVRAALASWQVDQVVITGASRDPIYASGFLTAALGVAPAFERRAWVWKVQPGEIPATPVTGVTLSRCRTYAATPAVRGMPLTMARCVMFAGGRAA
jgi:hypothetical protein